MVDDAMVEEREKRSSRCDPTILKHTAVSVQCPFIQHSTAHYIPVRASNAPVGSVSSLLQRMPCIL